MYFRSELYLPFGGFSRSRNFSSDNDWAHVMINYIGEDEQLGMELYLNGIRQAHDNTSSPPTRTQGNGRIVIGRFLTEEDHSYTTVEIDELLFFNATLTPDQITTLYTFDG